MRFCRHAGFLAALLGLVTVGAHAAAPPLAGFDFTKREVAGLWRPMHDISALEATGQGLVITISGTDPYTVGPAVDLPADADLWLRMRLKSDQIGSCQVFYWREGTGPSEDKSVRFAVPTTGWVERRVPLPALGPATRFRIDPPGAGGKVVIASMTFEPRVQFAAPEWPKPVPPALDDRAATVRAGDLVVRHAAGGWGDFEVRVADETMAVGLTRSLIGYVHDGRLRWVSAAGEVRDPDGATWRLARQFKAGGEGAVDVEVRVTVDAPREVVFLPMFFLVPGAGSFGAAKHQGLLAGLEYLADEPSSSEADVRGPESRRQVPDNLKLTMPLAVIQAKDRYVGLTWPSDGRFAAVFDSPDRLFGTGGHVMGLIFPGSDGENRPEGSLMPYGPGRLEAGKPLVLKATILGGKGASVIPAVQQYVRLRGLPPVPAPMDWPRYAALASSGWLDSKIREGDLYRHAYWPGFGPQPAADAAVWMEYLATHTTDAALARRLREAATGALDQVEPANYYHSGVSHVRCPVVSLVHGHVAESVAAARQSARGNLGRFEADGSVLYRQAEGKLDYGSTHFAKDSNGLTAQVVASVLGSAAYAGDADLVREGLRVLRALDKFANTVPRGAQTWEVPLHTPDILASAYLVRAYTLGYELTGDEHLLEQARYWAWTGVPLVYLVNPTTGPVGPYSTIAVLGATSWVAPVWFGRPVQWCGLVYADALYRLAPHDREGPWRQLADGITAAGIQHTWKQDDPDRQGLLPDFYHLREQRPDGPGINPGTVEANAIRLLKKPALYDMRVMRAGGIIVHAPGAIAVEKNAADGAVFRVTGWPAGPYYVLVSGLKKAPTVRLGGKDTSLTPPHEYLPTGNLVLRVEGEARVELGL